MSITHVSYKAVARFTLSVVLLLVLSACGAIAFDSDKWKDKPGERDRMVSSLLHTHELVGMTEDEIITLLGKPDEKKEEPDNEFVYLLGRAGLGVDDNLLILKFTEQGKLESHHIRQS